MNLYPKPVVRKLILPREREYWVIIFEEAAGKDAKSVLIKDLV